MKGKTALVTGASRGIGKAIAVLLAQHGCNVIINYNTDLAGAQELVSQFQKKNLTAVALKADVGNPVEVAAMFAEIKKNFSALDYVINNAGIVSDRMLKNMSEEEWNKVITVNLTGTYLVSKHAIELLSDGGSIVNVSSIIGLYGNIGQTNYAASKAGIIGFTKSLAKELAPKNIRVNAVAPGFIETAMTKEIPFMKKVLVKQFIPLKRLGDVSDVAHCVYFLLSDNASYITGTVISVDGGLMF